MKSYLKSSNNTRYTETKTFAKIKAICEHCGKKQTATAEDYDLNYVACKKCGKEGSLMEI